MKLEDQIKALSRRKGLAYKTEQNYVFWYRRFVRFHKLEHPENLNKTHIEAFLDHLIKSWCSGCYPASGIECFGFFVCAGFGS